MPTAAKRVCLLKDCPGGAFIRPIAGVPGVYEAGPAVTALYGASGLWEVVVRTKWWNGQEDFPGGAGFENNCGRGKRTFRIL